MIVAVTLIVIVIGLWLIVTVIVAGIVALAYISFRLEKVNIDKSEIVGLKQKVESLHNRVSALEEDSR